MKSVNQNILIIILVVGVFLTIKDAFYIVLFWIYLFLNSFCSFVSNSIALVTSSSDSIDKNSMLDSLKAFMQSFQSESPSGVSESRVRRRSIGSTAIVINFFSNKILTIFDMFDFSKRSVSPSSFWLIGPCHTILFNTLNCCCFRPNLWKTWFISLWRNRPHFNNNWTIWVSFSGDTGFFSVLRSAFWLFFFMLGHTSKQIFSFHVNKTFFTELIFWNGFCF